MMIVDREREPKQQMTEISDKKKFSNSVAAERSSSRMHYNFSV